jgi:hypothetical protein
MRKILPRYFFALLLPLCGCTTVRYVPVPCPVYPKPPALIPPAGELRVLFRMPCGEIAAGRSHHRALPLIRETLQMALQADGERKTPRLHLRGITAVHVRGNLPLIPYLSV